MTGMGSLEEAFEWGPCRGSLGRHSNHSSEGVPDRTKEIGQKNRQEEVAQTQEAGPEAGDDDPSTDEGFDEIMDPLLDESFDSSRSGIDGVGTGLWAAFSVFLPGLVASELADVREDGKVRRVVELPVMEDDGLKMHVMAKLLRK